MASICFLHSLNLHVLSLPFPLFAFSYYFFTGVVGVALTGWMLERAGGAATGWWQALATAAALCLAGSLHFLAFARGQRLFGSAEDL